ncbi:uncharacterized protein LOC119069574 isoform X1 [Bradysia coprophila]|uniref:uncharacterized protein LOC119069574 isoform X1 n=1 Tax=Bradysia coprophila TaxID=38358 RepID=UPI00187DBD8F|nr:uncharacterized protein LOC119069574 isoform X1 [Bradysia coprophila]
MQHQIYELNATTPDLSDVSDLNPIASEDSVAEGVDRDKRKIPDVVFAPKNAILGFVFGKIDSLLDAKTRFIDTLDKQNIIKNKQHHIEVPVPIKSFQGLIQAVISPKITAITSKIGSLSGAFGSSGSSGGGDGDGHAGGGASAGLGGIVSSFLKLSGPILSSSSGSASGGGGLSVGGSVSSDDAASDDDDEETPY